MVLLAPLPSGGVAGICSAPCGDAGYVWTLLASAFSDIPHHPTVRACLLNGGANRFPYPVATATTDSLLDAGLERRLRYAVHTDEYATTIIIMISECGAAVANDGAYRHDRMTPRPMRSLPSFIRHYSSFICIYRARSVQTQPFLR